MHAPTGPPWSFGARPTFLTSPHPSSSADPDVAAQHLVRRYLHAFGPARVQDMAQYALTQVRRVRRVVAALGDGLHRFEGPGGVELLDVPGVALPDEDTPAPPRLLPMWDSTLLAYADRSRIIPPDYRAHVIRRNGDTLPTLLVDGQVAGVWRTLDRHRTGGGGARELRGRPGPGGVRPLPQLVGETADGAGAHLRRVNPSWQGISGYTLRYDLQSRAQGAGGDPQGLA